MAIPRPWGSSVQTALVSGTARGEYAMKRTAFGRRVCRAVSEAGGCAWSKATNPPLRGREAVWACGIVRGIGWGTSSDAPSRSSHVKSIDIDPKFGVANRTGQGGAPGPWWKHTPERTWPLAARVTQVCLVTPAAAAATTSSAASAAAATSASAASAAATPAVAAATSAVATPTATSAAGFPWLGFVDGERSPGDLLPV